MQILGFGQRLCRLVRGRLGGGFLCGHVCQCRAGVINAQLQGVAAVEPFAFEPPNVFQPRLFHLAPGTCGAFLECIGKAAVLRHIKQLTQDVQTVFGARGQKPFEIALWQQDDLTKLRRAIAQQIQNAGIDLAHFSFGQDRAGGVGRDLVQRDAGHVEQIGLVGLAGGAFAARLGAVLVGQAAQVIPLVAQFKDETDLGECGRFGVVRPQAAGVLAQPGGVAKQGKGHGVEDRGFSRPGRPIDTKQARVQRGAKIHVFCARKRPKGGHGQAQWSHASCSLRARSARAVAINGISLSRVGSSRVRLRKSEIRLTGSSKSARVAVLSALNSGARSSRS